MRARSSASLGAGALGYTPVSMSVPHRVLQITDCHLFADPEARLLGVPTQQSLDAVLAAVSDRPRDLVILTGDLTQDAAPEGYRRLLDRLDELGTPFAWLPGNHDDPATMRACLAQAGRSAPDHVVLGDWLVVMLDTSVPGQDVGHLAEGELARLDRLLADHPRRHVLVCLHHHPVPVGCHWLDPIGLGNAGAFFRVLDRHPNVRGVLWGHVHQVFEARRDGRRLMASPSTCFQFKPRTREFTLDPLPPGWRELALYPDGTLQSRVHRLEDYEVTLDTAAAGY